MIDFNLCANRGRYTPFSRYQIERVTLFPTKKYFEIINRHPAWSKRRYPSKKFAKPNKIFVGHFPYMPVRECMRISDFKDRPYFNVGDMIFRFRHLRR